MTLFLGWGLLNETDDKGSNSLQYVSVPILDHDKCYDAYGRFVDLNQKGQFCAGNDKGMISKWERKKDNLSTFEAFPFFEAKVPYYLD